MNVHDSRFSVQQWLNIKEYLLKKKKKYTIWATGEKNDQNDELDIRSRIQDYLEQLSLNKTIDSRIEKQYQ